MKDTKKSKKKIWIALAIIVGAIVLSGAALGIATAIKRSNCEHVYGAWTVSEEVTCTEDGEEERECIDCGKTETREIKHYNHETRMVYAVEATCTTPGKTDGVQCIRCKKVLAGCEEVPARGHKPVRVDGYRAECLKDGLTSGVKCYRCDKVIESQKIIPATGHTVVTVEAKDPTCFEPGNTSYSYCSGCGEVYAEYEEIPALGHTDGVDVNSDVKCERCGLNGQEAYLEACQWEDAAKVTKLSKGETIAASEVAGAYRYERLANHNLSMINAFTVDDFTVALDGEIKTGELYIRLEITGGRVHIIFYYDDAFFRFNLTCYKVNNFYYYFYVQDIYDCDVTVTDSNGNRTTKRAVITINAMSTTFDSMHKLELIE